MIKSAYKTSIKKFEEALDAGNMEEAKALFDELGLDYNTRGETLTIEQFTEISNYIVDKNKNQKGNLYESNISYG